MVVNANEFSLLPILNGPLITLQPLRPEHEGALLDAARDGELWKSPVSVIPGPDTCAQYIETALAGRQADRVIPFVVVQNETGRVVGSTRFWKIDPANRKLEIGHTWLSRSVQRTGVNTEAKFLMLSHAFEVLHCVRVQFTTDELNIASRAAILRIGAKFEGVIRHERIMPDGRKRNSVRFSIIDSEWVEVREMLREKMHSQGAVK